MITSFHKWSKMIKLEHTLFSLPFVLSSAFLAFQYQGAMTWMPLLWISLALLGARSLGMTLNRIFDAAIDAKNPRTQEREIPQGNISKLQAWFFAALSFALMLWATLQLPKLCLYLMPVALLWLFAYSFFKRFSFVCHFVLGTTLGGAVLGAWIAVTGNLLSLTPVYLALAVSTWVSGFDIFYAIQDADFDKENKLHSIPAKFGIENAIKIAKLLHFLTPMFLFLAGKTMNLGIFYKSGILLVMLALFYEQHLVKEGKIEAAFFTVNSWISVVIFGFVLLEFYFG